MTFVFPILLSGLALAAIPVVLHFIVRHKPKTQPFPAFRFLVQKHRSNVRKLRLRQLLLLALRVLVIAAMCLALARPRLLQEGLGFNSEKPVSAVLVFDTSPSMDYRSSDGVSRLEEAKKAGFELLDNLPEASHVVVLDSADVRELGEEPWQSTTQARKRIAALKVRPANGPVTAGVEQGLRMLAEVARNRDAGKLHRSPRLLCVFSDRTRACWDTTRAPELHKAEDQVSPLYEGLLEARSQLSGLPGLLAELRTELPPPSGREYVDQSLLEAATALQDELRSISPEHLPPSESLQAALLRFRRLARELLAQVTSDSTEASPSDAYRGRVQAGLGRLLRATAGAQTLFFDVGMSQPVDVAVLGIDLPIDPARGQPRQTFAEGEPIELQVAVQATGKDAPATLVWQAGGVKRELREELKAGQARRIPLTLDAAELKLGPGPQQIEVRLEPVNDLLPFNNHRYATFTIRQKPRVLVLVDERGRQGRFVEALDALLYAVELKTARETADVAFDSFQAVYLLGLPEPHPELWARLAKYVRTGGSLGVVPAGEALKPAAYNHQSAQQLLPATFKEKIDGTPAVGSPWDWDRGFYQHGFMAPFDAWRKNANVNFIRYPRGAFHYWAVEPRAKESQVLVGYADGKGWPAVVERLFDGKAEARGKVLLFTTPLDRQEPAWNNYTEQVADSFYLAVVRQATRYLCGETAEHPVNFTLGQGVPALELPPGSRFASYVLRGNDLLVSVPPDKVPQRYEAREVQGPGNFVVEGRANEKDAGVRLAGFSVNVAAAESDLSRVPEREIETALGAGSLIDVERGVNLKESLRGYWSEPVEMFPYLMVLLLFVLAVENLLANKFYKQEAVK